MFVQEEKLVVPGVLRKLATERSLETLEQARQSAVFFEILARDGGRISI